MFCGPLSINSERFESKMLHPELPGIMKNNKMWISEEVDKYISVLKEKGIEYSTIGDYPGFF